MATSLSSQLKRLEAPQTSAFSGRKGRFSFLYSQNEAAGIDCDTHFALAIDGLTELVKLDPGLDHYRTSLLNESSRSFERGIRTKEENERLDEELELFLVRLVTQFFIRVESHKVLEYLIYKYRVNEFNVDALIMSALPYHSTSLFPKLLQAIPSFKDETKKWSFFKCVQTQGSPISRTVLVNRCLSEKWLLHLMTDTAVKEAVGTDGRCGKFATFATTILLSCQIATPDQEDVMTGIQSFVDSGLSSASRFFVLAAYTVIAFACSKVQFVQSFVKKLLSRSWNKFRKYSFRSEIMEEFVLMLIVVLDTQEVDAVSILPDSVVPVVAENMNLVSRHKRVVNILLQKLANGKSADSFDHFETLLSAAVSSKSLDRKTALDVYATLLTQLKTQSLTLEQKLVSLRFTLCLLRSGHLATKKMRHLVRDGEVVALAIDTWTLVSDGEEDGDCQRIQFSTKKQEWQDVTALLELVSGRQVKNAASLMEICQVLLRESLVFEEDADVVYYRRTLLRVVHQVISHKDFDWSGDLQPDASCIIDLMKAFRHQEGVRDCINIIKIIAKFRRTEILDNYMRVFSFVGCKYGDCDDRVSLSLMDGILCDLVPSLTDGDEVLVKRVIESLLDSLSAVAVHRRLHILDRFLQVVQLKEGKSLDFVIFLLIRRSVKIRQPRLKKLYTQFCAQLLSSISLSDAACYLRQLFDLIHRLLFLTDARPPLTTGGNSDAKGTSFPALILKLETEDSVNKDSLSEAVVKILIATLASDEYVRKVLNHANYTSRSSEPRAASEPEAVRDDGVGDNEKTSFVSKLVDEVIMTRSDGKVGDSTLSQLVYELIQKASLTLPVPDVVSLTARLLLQCSKLVQETGGDGNYSELMKLSIGMIWGNRERISECPLPANQPLFQCISSLACILNVTLKSESRVTSSASASPNKHPGTRKKRQRTRSQKLMQSSLSSLKLLVKKLGECSSSDERRFMQEMLLIFLKWIEDSHASGSLDDEPLVPFVVLLVTQMLKSLGPAEGDKIVSRVVPVMLTAVQSR